MKNFTILFFLFVFILNAQAQVFVKAGATGNNTGTSWSNAYTDLQAAFNSASPNDEIWIAAGVYVPVGPTPDSSHFFVRDPLKIYGGFAGNETNLSQRNWQTNLTVLEGDKKWR